jgi:hypothetical protein
MAKVGQTGRCVSCRAEISVPESYALGDQVRCRACGTQHKVFRSGEAVRLVIADVTGLRDAVSQNRELVARLEADLRQARGSLGMGVNGLGLGVAYVIWQIGQQDRMWSTDLLWEAAGVAVAVGVALEAANFLFLAKRQQMGRLSREIADARTDGRQLEQRLREAMKV